jgi:hypothetical protein
VPRYFSQQFYCRLAKRYTPRGSMKLFAIILLLFSFSTFAKLGDVDFTILVAQSEIIVFGVVKEIKIADDGSGYAKLKVLKSAKGNLESNHVIAHWSSEFHERRIHQANGHYLLFLSKNDTGNLIGSVHGRSFLRTQVTQPDVGDNYAIPFLIKNIPENLKGSETHNSCGKEYPEPRNTILIDRLFESLASYDKE